MAPDSSPSHSFQKLKLDTSAAHRPVASSIATLARQDSSNSDIAHPQPDSHATQPLYIAGRHSQHGSHARIASHRAEFAVGSSGSEEADIEQRFRHRSTSISFDTQVTLDTGDRVGLEAPIPKHARQSQSQSRSHSRTPESGSYSENEYLEMPFNQRNSNDWGRSQRPPNLHTAGDLARRPDFTDQGTSLTTATTASPPLDELPTPLETPSEYMLSPLSVTSTTSFPLFPRRANPSRNKSWRELSSSRRSSTRSGRSLSSMSPAASFLASLNASPIKPVEPDDEGQGIGYEGEYIIGKKIGYGGFSTVKEVTSIEEGRPTVHAVKIVRKTLSGKSETENETVQAQFEREVEIWRFLRHPHVLPLHRVYTTDFATFCITPLIRGGSLFDAVRRAKREKKAGLPRHLARRYAFQLASALRYLHNDVQVVHRDVKLENCLIDTSASSTTNAEDFDAGGSLLLCDFGMADFIVSDTRDGSDPSPPPARNNEIPTIEPTPTTNSIPNQGLAGSLPYLAPELISSTTSTLLYSPAADIWAFGIVAYALLTASLPFDGGLEAKTIAKIIGGEWDKERLGAEEESREVRELVEGCLEADVQRRWDVHSVLGCEWFRRLEEGAGNRTS